MISQIDDYLDNMKKYIKKNITININDGFKHSTYTNYSEMNEEDEKEFDAAMEELKNTFS